MDTRNTFEKRLRDLEKKQRMLEKKKDAKPNYFNISLTAILLIDKLIKAAKNFWD